MMLLLGQVLIIAVALVFAVAAIVVNIGEHQDR